MNKKTIAIIVAVIIFATFVGVAIWAFAYREVNKTIYAESIAFTQPTASFLAIDYDDEDSRKATIKVKIMPEDTTNKTVEFSSSNNQEVKITKKSGTEAEIEVLSREANVKIFAKTKDSSDLTAELKVFCSLPADSAVAFDPDSEAFSGTSTVYEYQANKYAMYNGYTYTINGVTAITAQKPSGGEADVIIDGNKITFKQTGEVKLGLTTAQGKKDVLVNIANYVDSFSLPASFKGQESYTIGYSNNMDFRITAESLNRENNQLEEVDDYQLKTFVKEGDGEFSDISEFDGITKVDNSVYKFDESLSGKNLSIRFGLIYQPSNLSSIDFIVKEGVNCFNFAQLRQSYNNLEVTGVIMHDGVQIKADDVPDKIDDDGGFIDARNGIFSRDYPKDAPAQTISFYGNDFTINYKNLPLVINARDVNETPEKEKIYYPQAALFRSLGFMDNITFEFFNLNVLGHTGLANDVEASGGLTAFWFAAALVDTLRCKRYCGTILMQDIGIRGARTGVVIEGARPSTFKNITIEDCYAHAINNYSTQLTIENGTFKRTSGPLLRAMHRINSIIKGDDAKPAFVFKGTFVAENWMFGNEKWMRDTGFSAAVLPLKGQMEGMFNQQGFSVLKDMENTGSQTGTAFNFIMILEHEGNTDTNTYGWLVDTTGVTNNYSAALPMIDPSANGKDDYTYTSTLSGPQAKPLTFFPNPGAPTTPQAMHWLIKMASPDTGRSHTTIGIMLEVFPKA